MVKSLDAGSDGAGPSPPSPWRETGHESFLWKDTLVSSVAWVGASTVVVIPIVIAFGWPTCKVETQLGEKFDVKKEGKSPICRSGRNHEVSFIGRQGYRPSMIMRPEPGECNNWLQVGSEGRQGSHLI